MQSIIPKSSKANKIAPGATSDASLSKISLFKPKTTTSQTLQQQQTNQGEDDGKPKESRLNTAARPIPLRMQKGSSQFSLATKQKLRAKPQEYAYSATASFQEITRLISLNDEQKQFIVKLQTEIKTLKIVNARQEKGLQIIDKDAEEFPKLFKAMNEELRVARADRQKAIEKVTVLEKQGLSSATEKHRLQQKVKELKQKLKFSQNPDVEALTLERDVKLRELEAANEKIEELSNMLKTITAERNREIVFAKQKHSKLLKELDAAKNETVRLTTSLKEKERTVNTLSIYSRHTMSDSEGESSHASSRRTPKVKKVLKPKTPLEDIPDEIDVVEVSLQEQNHVEETERSIFRGPKSEEGKVKIKNETIADESIPVERNKSPIPKHSNPKEKDVRASSRGSNKYSFFKPNLKTKSEGGYETDGGYSDDFHHD